MFVFRWTIRSSGPWWPSYCGVKMTPPPTAGPALAGRKPSSSWAQHRSSYLRGYKRRKSPSTSETPPPTMCRWSGTSAGTVRDRDTVARNAGSRQHPGSAPGAGWWAPLPLRATAACPRGVFRAAYVAGSRADKEGPSLRPGLDPPAAVVVLSLRSPTAEALPPSSRTFINIVKGGEE